MPKLSIGALLVALALLLMVATFVLIGLNQDPLSAQVSAGAYLALVIAYLSFEHSAER